MSDNCAFEIKALITLNINFVYNIRHIILAGITIHLKSLEIKLRKEHT